MAEKLSSCSCHSPSNPLKSEAQARKRSVLATCIAVGNQGYLSRLISSEGCSHDRHGGQEFHRPDGEYRVGLSEQQSDACVGNTWPDKPDSRGAGASLDREV